MTMPTNKKRAGMIRVRGNSRSMMVTFKGQQFSKALPANITKQRDIDRALNAFVAEVQSGAFAKVRQATRALSEAPTFNEAVTDFLANQMPIGLDGEATREAYRYGLSVVARELGETRVGDIRRQDMHRLLRGLRAGAKPLAIATLRGIYVRCNRLFKYLVEEGKIAVNPMPAFAKLDLGHDQAPAETARRSVMSPDQISAFLTACPTDDHALRLWFKIMVATGARAGEAAALHWRDIGGGFLTFAGAVKPVKGGQRGAGRIGGTKTRTVRTRGIGGNLAAALTQEKQRQESELRQLSGVPANVVPIQPIITPGDCVFPASPDNRAVPVSRDALLKRFARTAKRAGLQGVTPKWSRHTNVSRGIAGDGTRPGVSMVEAAALAGHANPLVTAKVYAHADNANLSRGVALGDDLIPASVTSQ
jgi:integrase